MDFLGNLTNYRQVFDPAIADGLPGTTSVWFELFAPNGTAVSGTEIPVFELRQQQFRPEATNIASSFFSTILSFFMPLAAILGAYSSYGKDRLTGVLESILARPISRRGLAISRFLSTLTALAVAAIVSVFRAASVTPLQSSNYGVTLPAIVLDGFLWAILPYLAFMYLAVKRD